MAPRAQERMDDDELEPELLRVIEALARAHAREDYAAARAAANPERT